MIQEDAFKSRTEAGGLTEREKGGGTLTLKVLLHTTQAHKSEKISLIHEFSQTHHRNINLKRYPVKIDIFFFLSFFFYKSVSLRRTLPRT